MKNKINLLLFTLLLAICSTMVSCSDDDDYSSTDLIGKWTVVNETGYDLDLQNPEYNQEWEDNYTKGKFTFEFYDDGEFYEIDNIEKYSGGGEWRIKGSKLYLAYDDEDDYEVALEIVKLTATDLILELHSKDQYYDHYNRTILERMD